LLVERFMRVALAFTDQLRDAVAGIDHTV
jgi:hypothetical protein